ncbi:hypothetical protein GOHSU_15_00060 [Gordonia hirsuta DSM 44140 = NBRC 16056]|uniref:Uncharacterized protein n=1 Tax=Gordonia hirsuta DSM 44140 = NBRC 16056 TaxID=1121927 RepID=L7L7Z0_9ACTN|nr:hypothetical protein [Gordonia hirsuta]GAC57014.1 hypothetical protein GOHSU_15_00060 [Gordonia hirsuta DSM 44140 = NBRC 16056]
MTTDVSHPDQAGDHDPRALPSRILTPTLAKQCWGFIIGSALFALGSAPGFAEATSANIANLCYFVGAWFFTGAALIQLVLSGKMTVPVSYAPGVMFRAEWLAGSIQFFGTLLFNVSTTAALMAHTVKGEQRLVWNPDAGGSVAFLLSGGFVLLAFVRAGNDFLSPRKVDFWSGQINWLGCVAFGVAAVGGFVSNTGTVMDNTLANWGTFIGALCFLVASAIALPRLPWNRVDGSGAGA